MKLPNLFYSFRARLLLVLALLLFATLVVQFYLNRLEKESHAVLIAKQEQALAASTSFALESITEPDKYMYEFYEDRKTPFLEDQMRRVKNILVVDEDGNVDDSFDKRYLPDEMEDKTVKYWHVSEVPLPPLVDPGQPVDRLKELLARPVETLQNPVAGEARAFPIPVVTRDPTTGVRGVNYIIVALEAAGGPTVESWKQSLEPLLPTLAVLLLATTAAAILVWRFTRPIKELSGATQRVAAGHFNFRLPGGDRRDETGALVATFNEMVARLGHMRELEVKIKQAEHSAVVGRLASAIAHEVRNPLNYINLTLDHLRTSYAPEDPKKRETFARLADQLKTEVARINTRITEFLKYTRPAALDLRPLDLAALAEDALRIVEVQASETGVQTSIERGGRLPEVRGDRESLRSAFTNLIINGMQAMGGEGGRLSVKLSAGDHAVRVEITDTGKGIAPEDLPKIFEPYYSTKDTGTGLGLAIVKKAIDDHGGHITVESKQGEGTTFTITLPTGKEG